jgi:hypothetical protein
VNPAWPALAAAVTLTPSYPPALDAAALSAWLREATDLTPEQVIAVSPSAATAIVARAATKTGSTELWLRAEALTPQLTARTGLLAWEMQLEVDCRNRLVRSGETRGYAMRTPEGDAVAVAPATSDWRAPAPRTALESAWQAVCEPGFQPPLAAAPARVARLQPKPAKPAPPPVVVPALAAAAPTGAARDASASAEAATPARGGHRAAQVVSSPNEADTQRSLKSLRMRFGQQLAGLETRIEPAQVGGRTVYRGLVAGFSTRDEASAFCADLKSHGQDCLAR